MLDGIGGLICAIEMIVGYCLVKISEKMIYFFSGGILLVIFIVLVVSLTYHSLGFLNTGCYPERPRQNKLLDKNRQLIWFKNSIFSLDISRYNIIGYCTEDNNLDDKFSDWFRPHESHRHLALTGQLCMSFKSYLEKKSPRDIWGSKLRPTFGTNSFLLYFVLYCTDIYPWN